MSIADTTLFLKRYFAALFQRTNGPLGICSILSILLIQYFAKGRVLLGSTRPRLVEGIFSYILTTTICSFPGKFLYNYTLASISTHEVQKHLRDLRSGGLHGRIQVPIAIAIQNPAADGPFHGRSGVAADLVRVLPRERSPPVCPDVGLPA